MKNTINRLIYNLSERFNINPQFIKVGGILLILFLIAQITSNTASLTFSSQNIVKSLFIILGVLPAIIIHEFCHGFAAYLLGDPTAKNMNRLSMNPLKHLNLFFLFLLLLAIFFNIGNILIYILIAINLAKPVPINPLYFKKFKRDQTIVAAAGPISNFILASLSMILISLLFKTPVFSQGIDQLLISFLYNFAYINVYLALFNLTPILPLDGGRVLFGLLPKGIDRSYQDTERYGFIIIIIMIYFDLFKYLPELTKNTLDYIQGVFL